MTTYSKLNFVYRLQKWMDSVAGQTFLNYAYSWGASIVILGTLFKLTHLPGANFFLFLGMGTEVFVFFISAFDRPFDKSTDGMDLDIHMEDAGAEQPAVNGAVAGGGVIGGNGGTVIINGGGGGVVGGVIGNGDHNLINVGKAGRKRHMGIRPTVRGSVMNPNDHPHGGGEGKTGIGRPGPSTPWGKPALGLKTRAKKKHSNKLIVRRRDGKAIK